MSVRPPHHFRKHPVSYVLRLFGDVRPGEATTVLLLALNVFLLLTAYYLLKVAREPLILLGGGAEVKSYASVGQTVLLVVVSSRLRLARGARRAHRAHHDGHAASSSSNLVVFWVLGVQRRSASASRSSCGSASSTS